MSFVTVQGNRFIDSHGRHLLLHGINLVNKDPSVGYLGDEGPQEFAAWHSWGLNCVRLGVIWDGLEPEPGLYNETYLQGIDQQIAWAAKYNLFVILDMHQDLYSVRFADGAPEWATLTNDQPHISESEVWSDAYFTSPAVHAAWDNFWKNMPAADGIGLQDHYARTWAMLAARYGDNPTVVGYDLMNEPMPGSLALQAQLLMLAKGAELLAKMDGNGSPNVMELAEQWLTPDGRSQILNLLRDIDLYMPVADAPEPLYAEFEREKLMPFYRRVASAIRAEDQNHIIFMGTTMGSNLGMRSHIAPLDVNGVRDPLQAYAPHGYDLVTDTPDIAKASSERVAFIFQRHNKTADRLNMPMLVGEWGAYDQHPGTLAPAQHVLRQFEQRLCSETYWTHLPGTENFPCFPAISRPYPQTVSGSLTRYSFDPDNSIFSCTWQEDPLIGAPSVIYLPNWFGFDKCCLELNPPGSMLIEESAAGCYLKIKPLTENTGRQLVIART